MAAPSRAILFSGDLGVAGAPMLRDPFTAWDPQRRRGRRRGHRVDLRRPHPPGRAPRCGHQAAPRWSERAHRRRRQGAHPGLLDRPHPGGAVRAQHADRGRRAARHPGVVDGPLGLSATRIYERHRELYDAEAMAKLRRGDHPLEFDRLIGARDAGVSGAPSTTTVRPSSSPARACARAAASATTSQRHLPDARTDVLLVGLPGRAHARPRPAGRRAARLPASGQEIPVRARITTISGLSAHADRDGLDRLARPPSRGAPGAQRLRDPRRGGPGPRLRVAPARQVRRPHRRPGVRAGHHAVGRVPRSADSTSRRFGQGAPWPSDRRRGGRTRFRCITGG
jgi:metallo-beta-lactamase family protein